MRTILILSSTLLVCDAKSRSAAKSCSHRQSSFSSADNHGSSSLPQQRLASHIPWTGVPTAATRLAQFPRGGQRNYGGYYDYDDNAGDKGKGSSVPYDDRYPDAGRSASSSQDYYDDYYGQDDGRNDEDRDYYDDRGVASRKEGGGVMSNLKVPNIIKTGNRQIGLPLLGIGAVLTILGVSLFFNKTLMRLGNLFFVAGVPMTIGPGRTAGYFFQPTKARATGCLTVGIFLVFVGWPVLGIILEIFGFLNLFGNMFPVAMAVLKTMPGIGPLLRGNPGRNKSDRYRGDDDDDYYGGGSGGFDRYEDRNYYDDGGDQDGSQGYY